MLAARIDSPSWCAPLAARGVRTGPVANHDAGSTRASTGCSRVRSLRRLRADPGCALEVVRLCGQVVRDRDALEAAALRPDDPELPHLFRADDHRAAVRLKLRSGHEVHIRA